MNFLSGSFRRAGINFPVPNCSPYGIRLQGDTLIIETRPRECFVAVTLKEVLTPEWDATTGLRFTNKQSYEVNTAGPFPSSINFPMVPRPGMPLPGMVPSGRPGVQLPGMAQSGRPGVPQPGMAPSGRPGVPLPGMVPSGRPGVPQPGMPSSNQPAVPRPGTRFVPGFPSNQQLGLRMFMPLTLSNNQQTGSSSSQTSGSTTRTGGSPPPVPAPLTSGTASAAKQQ
ncbi:P30 adhesin-like [Pecten maximus]|uniref:P30 adhesin-like n=1 Tax=Pecten maximus TaxID=6579 RepID=UPI001457E9AA|nr:P30 adhesin-like [Pecten maximus]